MTADVVALAAAVAALRDRLDAAERSLGDAHQRVDALASLVSLYQHGRASVEDELAARLDAVERALAAPAADPSPDLVAAGERVLG